MSMQGTLREAQRLRLKLQMDSRLHLEVLAALSKTFRENGEKISNDLLRSLVFAVPDELPGEGEVSKTALRGAYVYSGAARIPPQPGSTSVRQSKIPPQPGTVRRKSRSIPPQPGGLKRQRPPIPPQPTGTSRRYRSIPPQPGGISRAQRTIPPQPGSVARKAGKKGRKGSKKSGKKR